MSSIKDENEVIVYTGHSNHAFDKLAQLLQQHSIQVVIDVRSRPQSRWVPWFNQRNLETAIPPLGIEYQWAGNHLGGLPNDPALYMPNAQRKRKADPPRVVDYDLVARQDWFRAAIDELLTLASHKRIALMCAEENPQRCHRSQLIGQTLVKRGVKVLHIRKEGELEPQDAAAHSA